jgi:hypothetical protein
MPRCRRSKSKTLPTDSGGGNGEPKGPVQVELRIHSRPLPDALVVRLELLGITCAAMCPDSARLRLTIVRRIPGLVLIGASTVLVCVLHAQQIAEAASAGRPSHAAGASRSSKLIR